MYAANIGPWPTDASLYKTEIDEEQGTHSRRICTHEIMRYTTKSIKYICICIVLTSLRWLTTNKTHIIGTIHSNFLFNNDNTTHWNDKQFLKDRKSSNTQTYRINTSTRSSLSLSLWNLRVFDVKFSCNCGEEKLLCVSQVGSFKLLLTTIILTFATPASIDNLLANQNGEN